MDRGNFQRHPVRKIEVGTVLRQEVRLCPHTSLGANRHGDVVHVAFLGFQGIGYIDDDIDSYVGPYIDTDQHNIGNGGSNVDTDQHDGGNNEHEK